MKTMVKLFSAASIEGVEKKINEWFEQCDEDDAYSYVIESMHMATYPGASTGMAFLVTKVPVSEEAQIEEDQKLLRRLLERGGASVVKRIPASPVQDAPSVPTNVIELSANERSAEADAKNAPTKPCGCTDNEMCVKCDNGSPLDPTLARMVSGLPGGADTAAAARAVGADDAALDVFRASNEGATPVE